MLIALGSNQGLEGNHPKETVSRAFDRLARESWVIRATSGLYQTPAFPPGLGPDFVNAVVKIETDAAPAQILDALHRIEAEFGRRRDRRWGQRVLDLDLIAAGSTVLPDAETQAAWRHLPLADQMRRAPKQLILPHPRMQDRVFVLVPLADVAPDWRHPLLKRTVRQMLDALPQADKDAVKLLDNGPERA